MPRAAETHTCSLAVFTRSVISLATLTKEVLGDDRGKRNRGRSRWVMQKGRQETWTALPECLLCRKTEHGDRY